jgi:hypothetical protein
VGGAELEPFGTNAGLFKGFMMPPPPSRATLEAEMNYPFFSNMGTGLCTVDRIESPCYMFGLDAVTRPGANQPAPKPKKPKPVDPMPGLNPFTGEVMRKKYGNTQFARNGTGVIEFSSIPSPFAGLSILSRIAPHDTVQPIDVKGIRAELARMVGEPECANFIKELLDRASSAAGPRNPLVEGGDVLKIFDLIMSKEQKGIVRDMTRISGGLAGGSVRTHSAQIILSKYPISSFVPPNVATAWLLKSDSDIALHETLHHAGEAVYFDYDLAVAVSKMPGATPLPKGTGDPYIKDRFIYSNYWNGELKNHCK